MNAPTPAPSIYREFVDSVAGVRRPATASVEAETDTNFPGRTTYVIRAKTRESVQAQISRLQETVDVFGGVPGRALFIGPHRAEDGSGYVAVGEIVKERP